MFFTWHLKAKSHEAVLCESSKCTLEWSLEMFVVIIGVQQSWQRFPSPWTGSCKWSLPVP